MIRSFRHKGLLELWTSDRTARIDARLHKRVLVRLDRMDAVSSPQDMNVPGFDFHMLRGFQPTRYTVHVNGPWCITFAFVDGEFDEVDLEQYH